MERLLIFHCKAVAKKQVVQASRPEQGGQRVAQVPTMAAAHSHESAYHPILDVASIK